ncbi:bifunctional DNA primase/polymerase [Mycolicibacterium stellerae]|uniref:bifunctional DNA primase/polymerase n=1 Tax=Mycolicibacterium stellerae TaxID=2358193 RepID=UPI000F0B9CA2|nr:bifunctional DNA primase/polymerase [Mycolicibacterium stellerae]
MSPIELPDVTGLDVFDAAVEYAASGVPVAPFDPSKGKGKSCWNLVGYRDVTTEGAQLLRWREQFGSFQALATSPGQFGCVVLDVDRPPAVPKQLRSLLDTAPYVNTRPESPKRGHYWFVLPKGLQLGNPTLGFGEVRCVGGGIVLPPYGDRRVVRPGVPLALPDELASAIDTHDVSAGAGRVDLGWFFDTYTEAKYPHKLRGLQALHCKVTSRQSPHDAMRTALNVGFGEAVIGYVDARSVYDTLLALWDSDRSRSEFDRLASSCAGYVLADSPEAIKRRSDRCTGTDSRDFIGGYKVGRQCAVSGSGAAESNAGRARDTKPTTSQ